jgi:hypothetical protein
MMNLSDEKTTWIPTTVCRFSVDDFFLVIHYPFQSHFSLPVMIYIPSEIRLAGILQLSQQIALKICPARSIMNFFAATQNSRKRQAQTHPSLTMTPTPSTLPLVADHPRIRFLLSALNTRTLLALQVLRVVVTPPVQPTHKKSRSLTFPSKAQQSKKT